LSSRRGVASPLQQTSGSRIALFARLDGQSAGGRSLHIGHSWERSPSRQKAECCRLAPPPHKHWSGLGARTWPTRKDRTTHRLPCRPVWPHDIDHRWGLRRYGTGRGARISAMLEAAELSPPPARASPVTAAPPVSGRYRRLQPQAGHRGGALFVRARPPSLDDAELIIDPASLSPSATSSSSTSRPWRMLRRARLQCENPPGNGAVS